MAKKLGIEKKLETIIKESEHFLNKKKYSDAIKTLREGLSLIRTKVKDNEEKQIELDKVKSKIGKIYVDQIEETINQANDLGKKRNLRLLLMNFIKLLT